MGFVLWYIRVHIFRQSLRETSDSVGYSASTLERSEAGYISPRLVLLEDICEELELDLDPVMQLYVLCKKVGLNTKFDYHMLNKLDEDTRKSFYDLVKGLRSVSLNCI